MIKGKGSSKFLTYDLLKHINDIAVHNKLNRSLHFDLLPIAKAEIYPVTLAFPHNETEMRCEIIFNRHGDKGFLDMPLDIYARLPTYADPTE